MELRMFVASPMGEMIECKNVVSDRAVINLSSIMEVH